MSESGILTDIGSRPVPDPTVLTTQQLFREIAVLTASFSAEVASVRRELPLEVKAIETRLDGYDQAITLLQTILDRFPKEIDVKVENLKSLHEERFKGLETRILERDDNVTQAKADAKVGIDAALASAEKLVGQSNDSFKELFEKAERSTEKLLDKQDENQKNSAGALEDKIAGLKERLDRIEGAAVGAITQKADTTAIHTETAKDNSWNLSLLLAAIVVTGFIIDLFTRFGR